MVSGYHKIKLTRNDNKNDTSIKYSYSFLKFPKVFFLKYELRVTTYCTSYKSSSS